MYLLGVSARPQWGHNFGKKYWSVSEPRGLVFPCSVMVLRAAEPLLYYVDVGNSLLPELLIRWGSIIIIYFLSCRQYYNDNVKSLDQDRDIAANKTKAVAWFVSNCGARNGRLNYAKELGKYIQVSRQQKELLLDQNLGSSNSTKLKRAILPIKKSFFRLHIENLLRISDLLKILCVINHLKFCPEVQLKIVERNDNWLRSSKFRAHF